MNRNSYEYGNRANSDCSGSDRTVSFLEAAELSDRFEGHSGSLASEHRRFTFMLPATQSIVSLIIE